MNKIKEWLRKLYNCIGDSDFWDVVGDTETSGIFCFLETLEKTDGWKRLYKEPKRTVGLGSAHRKTPIWEAAVLMLLTVAAFIEGACFLIGLIIMIILFFTAEWCIWMREKIKTRRQTIAVKKAMDEHRKRTANIMEERKNKIYESPFPKTE